MALEYAQTEARFGKSQALRTGVRWRGLGKTHLWAPHHRQTLANNSLGNEAYCLAKCIWPRLLVTVEMGGLDTKKGPAHVMCRTAISLTCLYLLLLFYVRLFALTFLVLVNLAKQCVYTEVYAFLKGVAHLFCMKVGAGK